MKTDDRQLVINAQNGDQKAFGKLIKRYQDKVLFLAYDLVGNYSDAQDIAQNAFMRAMRGLSSFKAQSTFSTWLYRIVVNLTIDHKRAISRRRTYSFDEHTSEDSDQSYVDLFDSDDKLPDEIAELKDFDRQVKQIIESLPHNQKVAFVMRHYHDMDMTEIANVLNCKPGTVRSHLFRAIAKLRSSLKDFEQP